MSNLGAKFVEYASGTPNDPDGGSWNQKCAKGMSRFQNFLGSWSKAPSKFGPGAIDVARASGALNTDSSKAPIGAYHFWNIGTYGHVAIDLDGGGTVLGMMGTTALTSKIHDYIGISSVSFYTSTKKAQYLGWANNYAGGIGPRPAEPAADPTIRHTVAAGANVRSSPVVNPTNLLTPFKGNIDVKMKGWVTGEETSGNRVWYVSDYGYSHISGFTPYTTDGLPNLDPPPVVVPPVVVPPPVVEPPVVVPPVVVPPVVADATLSVDTINKIADAVVLKMAIRLSGKE